MLTGASSTEVDAGTSVENDDAPDSVQHVVHRASRSERAAHGMPSLHEHVSAPSLFAVSTSMPAAKAGCDML